LIVAASAVAAGQKLRVRFADGEVAAQALPNEQPSAPTPAARARETDWRR